MESTSKNSGVKDKFLLHTIQWYVIMKEKFWWYVYMTKKESLLILI